MIKRKLVLNINAPISIGELIDKITILQIKKEYMSGDKLKNVSNELKTLKLLLEKNNLNIDSYFFNKLKEVNSRLWDIEDNLRFKESKKEFDDNFINLARSVYQQNDIRASLKKEINYKYNSSIIEEKSYTAY